MNMLNLLGISWYHLPVIFDIAYESMYIRDFHIIKNIPVEGEMPIDLNKDFYNFTIHGQDERRKFVKGTLFFGVTGPKGKSAVFNYFSSNYKIDKSYFINIIHPSAYLATSIKLNTGILVEPGVIVSSQTIIGFGVTIKRGVSIGHHDIIDDYTEINPGVIISGNVRIGRGCILGAGCIISNQVSIGENTFIGMGSVVNKNIPAGVIAYGNPCKVIRENDKWKI